MIEYRKLTSDQLDTFIQMRIRQLREEGATEEIDLVPALEDYYHRQGIAKELLSRVVNEARVFGCGCVQITASDMGTLLYSDFGFVRNGNFMQYKL